MVEQEDHEKMCFPIYEEPDLPRLDEETDTAAARVQSA